MYMYYFLGHQLMDNHALTDAQKEVKLGNCQKMLFNMFEGESGKHIPACS